MRAQVCFRVRVGPCACVLEAELGCRKAAVSGQDEGGDEGRGKGNGYNFWSKLITKRGI